MDKKVKITLLSTIKRGRKSTRYLTKYNNNYASVKLDNNENYSRGMEIEVSEKEINDKEFKEAWVKDIKSWEDKKRKILEHLSKYKKEKITETEGYWRNKDGDIIFYPHILPDDEEKKNILDSAYKASIENLYDEKKNKGNNVIHIGFKNLNSSQAFAFNFFKPIIDENIFDKLLSDSQISTIDESDFEKKNPDRTQFDFFLQSGKVKCCFEVKYTESDFGAASQNSDYSNYKEKLKELLKEKIEKEDFFDEYQLWRNIIFALDGYQVFFVFPKFRDDLAKKVEDAKNKCKDNFKDNIKILYVNDFVEKMKNSENKKLRDHYTEFSKKYLEIPTI
ncbi:MAG: hypothetical protein IKZ57_00425 [Spirochaetia bacterium]|nr:hypothetical protein [Spirochaetia bacterium]